MPCRPNSSLTPALAAFFTVNEVSSASSQTNNRYGGAREGVSNLKPRTPTEDEKRELAKFMIEESGIDLENISGFIENSAIAVFDDYITVCPGYAGKVMMVVWEAGPAVFDVYTWRDGQIKQQERG